MSDLSKRLRGIGNECVALGYASLRHNYFDAADELDRLNAQALELCAEISGLRRENDGLRGLVRQGQNYAIDAQDVISGSKEYKADLAAFIEACDSAAVQPTVARAVKFRCPECGASTWSDESGMDGNEFWHRTGCKGLPLPVATSPTKAAPCPNALLPDGPVCPRCGGRRGPSGIDGGSWVHY